MVENPKGSLLFDSAHFIILLKDVQCWDVHFQQCAYGLKLIGARSEEYCRKDTRVIGNFADVSKLHRMCPGVGRGHRHVHAFGSVSFQGRTYSRAKSAGVYPHELCRAMADLVWSKLGGWNGCFKAL